MEIYSIAGHVTVKKLKEFLEVLPDDTLLVKREGPDKYENEVQIMLVENVHIKRTNEKLKNVLVIT